MSAVCPNGHVSEAEDYCDTCGSPIDLAAQPAPAASATGGGQGAAGSPAGSSAASGSSLDLGPDERGAATGTATGTETGTATGAAQTTGAPAALECPNCHTENPDGALFCEACGYDFTTGAMPRDPSVTPGELVDTEPHEFADSGEVPAASVAAGAGAPSATAAGPGAGAAEGEAGGESPAAFEWLAEVWVDPDWYQTQEAEDPCPSPGLPTIMPLRHRSVLLGRVSTSRNTHPEIDLSSDPGVSRRHAQLTTDGTRWFVEDLGSSNGTYVGPASGPLPETAIAVGPRTELGDDDRLYVGAWTRVVVRRATPDEVEAYA
ncbi:FHA domain-containing protein [Terrabacter sp. NPDC080008]|uniref:FHA domain-containing protein n=1 Tax=Terrabacter sp. NPDC080008 TaxID=3155176 RepID=UPI00344B5C08